MKKLFTLALVVGCGAFAYAQNCTQTLRTARTTYEQGRLHEIPTILEKCLEGDNFSETQKVEAYKILVLTYIYLEEPQKADAAMLKLLETDHFFEVNKAADPIEFKNLYAKFRTTPLYRFGVKFGVNNNIISVQENHYVWASGRGKGEYKSNIGIQVGLLFEKDFWNKFVFNPEIFYVSNSFIYQNPSISSIDNGELNTDRVEFTISQQRLQANFLVQYRYAGENWDKKLSPYVALGPSIGMLNGSTFGGDLIVGSQITIPDIDTKKNYKAITYSVIAAAGVKYKVGSFYLTADVRYQHGLVNIVNESNRYKRTPENIQLENYGYRDNDFRLSHSMINIGLIIPHFSPKKLMQ